MSRRFIASGLATVVLLAAGTTDLPAQRATGAARASEVQRVVQQFYDAFNSHHFDQVSAFTTEDWVHINPSGGATHGRAAVLAELRQVHGSFLKGVTDTPESIAVRFATNDVAVATVPSRMSSFTTPDRVRHEREPHIRTFVLVRRAGAWRIMQDQNTVRAP